MNILKIAAAAAIAFALSGCGSITGILGGASTAPPTTIATVPTTATPAVTPGKAFQTSAIVFSGAQRGVIGVCIAANAPALCTQNKGKIKAADAGLVQAFDDGLTAIKAAKGDPAAIAEALAKIGDNIAAYQTVTADLAAASTKSVSGQTQTVQLVTGGVAVALSVYIQLQAAQAKGEPTADDLANLVAALKENDAMIQAW
ncbi:MAG TPA: hypothetical protein VGF56_05695 [Rhizomicrobium sp.]|jgi:hypothetical protein